MTRRLLPLAFVLAALPACGGTDDGRPNGDPVGDGSPLDPCEADDGYEFQNFVNFEGEPMELPTQPVPVTTAACDPAISCNPNPFYFNYDQLHSNPDPVEANTHRCIDDPPSDLPEKTLGCDCEVPVNPGVPATSDPNIRAQTLYGREVVDGRCDVPSYALHITATNIAMCYGTNGRLGWGAGLDVNFARSAPEEVQGTGPGTSGFDASAFDGISFWVKKGASGKSTFIMTVSDPGTTMPACSDVETMPDAAKCDAFGIAVTLTDEWTFIPAVFRSMRQKGFGKPSPNGQLDNGNIKKIQFLMSAGDWDFWIDDLAFFNEPR